MGSSFPSDLIPSAPPSQSLPSHPPGRALQGGLSRSFGASGNPAAGHSSVTVPLGTASHEAPGPSSEAVSPATDGAPAQGAQSPDLASTGHSESAPNRASRLPPLSPSQPSNAAGQQLPAGQLPAASAHQMGSSEGAHPTPSAAQQANGFIGSTASQVDHNHIYMLYTDKPTTLLCVHVSLKAHSAIKPCMFYHVCSHMPQ